MQNQTVSHTIDELQNTLTWQDKSLCTLNENHSSDDDSDIEGLEGNFWKEIHKQYKLMSKISIVPIFHFRMMFAVALPLNCHNN